ncbi:MAG: dienelactone hydrolase family protein [Myxococcales bacterium]|nr:dienelactone hydrolase family protein [Myxococcales bacterium]
MAYLLPWALAACDAAPAAHLPKPRVEHWQTVAGLEFLEVIPAGPGADARLPMVVFIHGLGDHPQAAWIEPDAPTARYILPRAPQPHGKGFSWFPYRVGTKHPALPSAIEGAIEQLAQLLKHLAHDKPTAGRAVLSGFSQGGILSFGLALRHPQLVGLAHPVSGWLPPSLWPAAPRPKVRNPPIVAAHGTADSIVPLAPTRQMVKTLAARGFDIRLKEFEGIGHGQSEPMKALMEALVDQGIADALRRRGGLPR